MDQAKRAEPYARRAAILAEKERQDWVRRRAEYVAMVPILRELEAVGEDYDSFGYRELSGPLNWWACHPDRYLIREQSHADLPLDPDLREAMILDCLRQRFGADDTITVILRREELVLTMRMPVLARHLRTLFENTESNWLGFTAPPADWIIAVRHIWREDGGAWSSLITAQLPKDDRVTPPASG